MGVGASFRCRMNHSLAQASIVVIIERNQPTMIPEPFPDCIWRKILPPLLLWGI
jgi:hypothetical protein